MVTALTCGGDLRVLQESHHLGPGQLPASLQRRAKYVFAALKDLFVEL